MTAEDFLITLGAFCVGAVVGGGVVMLLLRFVPSPWCHVACGVWILALAIAIIIMWKLS